MKRQMLQNRNRQMVLLKAQITNTFTIFTGLLKDKFFRFIDKN